MIGVIYKITNNLNNKVYIGQTIQPLKDRWYRHCGKTGSDAELSMAIKRAILKYGKQNFTIEEIESCDTERLDEREKYWIDKYDSYNFGYNCTKGGQNGAKPQKLLVIKDEVIDLYNSGFSLREIARNYQVDHATIKQLLERSGIELRATRTYKLSQKDREKIIHLINSGVSRKEVMRLFKISKSYLSQLVNKNRRI